MLVGLVLAWPACALDASHLIDKKGSGMACVVPANNKRGSIPTRAGMPSHAMTCCVVPCQWNSGTPGASGMVILAFKAGICSDLERRHSYAIFFCYLYSGFSPLTCSGDYHANNGLTDHVCNNHILQTKSCSFANYL